MWNLSARAAPPLGRLLRFDSAAFTAPSADLGPDARAQSIPPRRPAEASKGVP